MSNATIFLALQCCQCSIMQVKQKKKSSSDNKWTCVVCNQKQSVRKVFAQGYMAKHLRPFVQSFNMKQQQQEEEMPNKKTKLSLSSSRDDDQFYTPNLSSQAHDKEKPRTSQLTNKPPDDMQDPSKAASRWSEYLTEDDQEPPERGEWRNGVFKTQTSQPTMTNKTRDDRKYPSKAASRWSEYLTEDDQEPQEMGERKNGVFETHTHDLKVEDDIHPDFI